MPSGDTGGLRMPLTRSGFSSPQPTTPPTPKPSRSPPPYPRTARAWVCTLLFLATATLVLNLRTIIDLDAQRPAPDEAIARHPSTLDANDTFAFSYHLERSADAAGRGRIYFPLTEFDCPVTFLVPCGELKWVSDWPPVRLINLFTLVAVFLNGVAAFGFLRAVGAGGPVAAVAALGFMTPNFVLYSQHMGHMNYVQLQWIAFAFWALVAVLRPGSGWLPAVALGVVMGLQVLSSPSFSLYLAYVGLPVFAVTHRMASPSAARQPLGRLALRALIAVAVAVAIAAPYLIPRFDAMPDPLRMPTGRAFTWNSFAEMLDPTHPMLFLGTPLFVLGVLAVRWWWRNRTPSGTAMLVTLVAAAVCMLPAVPGTPYWVLRECAPLFDRMRVPSRFFPFVLLMVLGLVATYLSSGTGPRGRWYSAGALLAALTAGNWLLSPWLYGITIEQPQ
jgi:hypothetical protein